MVSKKTMGLDVMKKNTKKNHIKYTINAISDLIHLVTAIIFYLIQIIIEFIMNLFIIAILIALLPIATIMWIIQRKNVIDQIQNKYFTYIKIAKTPFK